MSNETTITITKEELLELIDQRISEKLEIKEGWNFDAQKDELTLYYGDQYLSSWFSAGR